MIAILHGAEVALTALLYIIALSLLGSALFMAALIFLAWRVGEFSMSPYKRRQMR